MSKPDFRLKEQSFLARIAAKKLHTDSVAMVIGGTIHLHNISAEEFLQNKRLMKHELCHVQQYKQHGMAAFLIKYLWESICRGYYNNRFEAEARAAEEVEDASESEAE